MKIIIKIFLKLSLVAICFYLVRDKLDIDLLKILGFNEKKIFLSFLIFTISQILLAIRLKFIINYFNESITIKKAIIFNFIAKIYSLFGLLGLVVDTSRFILLSNEIKSKKNIFQILLLDRILGVLSILSLTILSAIFYYFNYLQIKILLVLIFILLIIILLIIIRTRIYSLFLPDFLNKIKLSLNKDLCICIFYSILTWILIIFSLEILFEEFISFNLITIFALLISLSITLIPISPLGIGSAQLGAVIVFGYFGLNPKIGFLMISYMQLFMIMYLIIFSMPVNIYYIFYKRLK